MAIAATPTGGLSSEDRAKIDSALQPEDLPSEDLNVGNATLTGTELDVTDLDIATLTLTANTTIANVVGLKAGGLILNIVPAGFTLSWAESLINPLNIEGDAFDVNENMLAKILCTSESPLRFRINYDVNYAPVVPAPAAPSGLTADAINGGQIDLAWTDNSTTETLFSIERKTGVGGTYAEIDTVAAEVDTYEDPTVAAETEYYYRVRAYDGSQYSTYSNEANDTTPAAGPVLERTIDISFGNANSSVPTNVNNLNTNTPNTSYTKLNLIDSTGAATGINISIPVAFNAAFNNMPTTGANSGIVADLILQGCWSFEVIGQDPSEIQIENLPAKKFVFKILGNSGGWGAGPSESQSTYRVGAQAVSDPAQNNNFDTMQSLIDLLPDGSNNIVLECQQDSGGDASGRINFLRIEQYSL